jgi:dUTP pyrophosphatase
MEQNGQIELQVKLLNPEAKLPIYGSEFSAGMDITACITNNNKIIVHSGQTKLIKTGLSVSWTGNDAENYYLRVAPRSGLAYKNGIFVNAGVIDWDYRGEIGVVLYNSSLNEFEINNGDRIAQLILEKINRVKIIQVDNLDETIRGSNGFGSTGL